MVARCGLLRWTTGEGHVTVWTKTFELHNCVINYLCHIWSLFVWCVQPYAHTAVTIKSAEVVQGESNWYSTFLSFASYHTNVSTSATTIGNRGEHFTNHGCRKHNHMCWPRDTDWCTMVNELWSMVQLWTCIDVNGYIKYSNCTPFHTLKLIIGSWHDS